MREKAQTSHNYERVRRVFGFTSSRRGNPKNSKARVSTRAAFVVVGLQPVAASRAEFETGTSEADLLAAVPALVVEYDTTRKMRVAEKRANEYARATAHVDASVTLLFVFQHVAYGFRRLALSRRHFVWLVHLGRQALFFNAFLHRFCDQDNVTTQLSKNGRWC
jgi:hypothetical protein